MPAIPSEGQIRGTESFIKTVGFPIFMNIVLIFGAGFIGWGAWEDVSERCCRLETYQQKTLTDLVEKSTMSIHENTGALEENSRALDRSSRVLDRVERRITFDGPAWNPRPVAAN